MKRFVFAILALAVIAVAASASAQDRWKDTEPLELPKIEEHRLDNGLLVLIYENHQIPYAAAKMAVKTGALQDPQDKAGLADMTTMLLTYGTKTLSEKEIAGTVDFLGATLDAGAGHRSMVVYGNVTTVEPKNLSTFLDLFADVIRSPSFPEDAIAKVKQQKKGHLASLRDENAALAGLGLEQSVYRGHPLGQPVLGYPTTIDAIDRRALAAFHRRNFVPEQMVLGVAGDVDAKRILSWAKERFGDPAFGANCDGKAAACADRICAPGPVPQTCAKLCLGDDCVTNRTLDMPEPPAPDGPRVVLVDKRDPTLNQVQWQLGQPGAITYKDDGWFPWRLGTHVLGGDFTARINQLLRVKEGLTYGARMQVDHDTYHPGQIAVSTFVKPKDLVRSVELAKGELERAVSEPMSQEELDSFKAKLIEAQPFRFETPNDILNEFMVLRQRDMPNAFLANFPVSLAGVTAEQVLAALKKGIDPSALVLVAVGNADMADELQSLLPEGRKVEVVGVDSLFEPPAVAAPAE